MSRRHAALILGVAAAVRGLAAWWLGFRPFDDTFITFRYSLNLASGHGMVYNVGEPVLGTTSPLWAVVLALFRAAGVGIEDAALAVALACDAATALFLFRLLAALGFQSGIPLAGGLIFLGLFDYLSLSRSGMETSLFVALVVGALEAMVARRLTRASALSVCALLTRPEGVLLVALLPAALWHARRHVTVREVWPAIAIGLAVPAAWALYAVVTFGSVVPQSVQAKAAAGGDEALASFSWANLGLFFLRGQYGGEIFERTYLQLAPVLSALAAAGAAVLLADLVRTRDRGAAARAAALLFFPACFVSGLAVTHAFTFFPWYYGPIYPFLAALAPIGAGTIVRGRTAGVLTAAAALVAAQLTAAILVKVPSGRSYWVDGYIAVSRDIPRDKDVAVAALEIGAVGWQVWPAPVLDLAGLVTPRAVGVPAAELVARERPDYIVLRTDDGAAFLASVAGERWFQDAYALASVRPDPYQPREFRRYKKRGGDDPRP